MPAVYYAIDGTPVNDRDDWRSQRVPGQIMRQLVGYPGSAASYIRKGQPRGTRFVFRGFLEGDTLSDLTAEVEKFSAMRADLIRHIVTWHDQQFTNLDLAGIQLIGKTQGFRDASGSVRLRQKVAMIWEEAVG